jgi:hypothetical protein
MVWRSLTAGYGSKRALRETKVGNRVGEMEGKVLEIGRGREGLI